MTHHTSDPGRRARTPRRPIAALVLAFAFAACGSGQQLERLLHELERRRARAPARRRRPKAPARLKPFEAAPTEIP